MKESQAPVRMISAFGAADRNCRRMVERFILIIAKKAGAPF
jgi:hypothetical protein